MGEMKPLTGLKVIDFSQGVAGPYSGMVMAQAGATVTKVEPLDGEWSRTLGKMYGDYSAHAVACNLGKKSIALNLKSEAGLEIAQKLVEDADVVIESFRPGVMAKFGLDYPSLVQRNRNVIYLSVSGFGQEGLYSKLPTTDTVTQAFSGWMSITRDMDGAPMKSGMVAIDFMTGLFASQSLFKALLARSLQGEGSYIDCSMMQSAAAFQAAKIMEHHLQSGKPEVLYVPAGTMKTADGYIAITAMREHHYVDLCSVLGRKDLVTDTRFSNRKKRVERQHELMDLLGSEFMKKPTAHWARALTKAGVMNSPVNTYTDYLEDPHVCKVGSVSWVNQTGLGKVPLVHSPGFEPFVEGDPQAKSPAVGEHTQEILVEFGFSEGQINQWEAVEAIRTVPVN
ncbi:CoA transferase [Rhodobacteraceae bacterium D3-12]|nr:CoA transferase [Rhodobacteraceae bacterium D3-12]